MAEPISRGWRWLPAAVVVGIGPLYVAYLFGSPGHQWVTALLLTVLCLPIVWRDHWRKGLATIGLTFVAHCCAAIWLAHIDPLGAAEIFPDGADYWRKQHTWITTGVDEEYELSTWVPAHAQLAVGTTVFSFTSLGAIAFQHGFYEVDLMNYYNGRLLSHSRDPVRSLWLGWHIWSVLRGVGYTVICYEMMSLSLQFFSRQSLTTARRHAWRFALGLAFLVSDGVVKATVMEAVRLQLLENLIV